MATHTLLLRGQARTRGQGKLKIGRPLTTINAAATVVLPALTIGSTATVGLHGQATVTLAPLTASGQAGLGLLGSASVTLPAVSIAAAGILQRNLNATLTAGYPDTAGVQQTVIAPWSERPGLQATLTAPLENGIGVPSMTRARWDWMPGLTTYPTVRWETPITVGTVAAGGWEFLPGRHDYLTVVWPALPVVGSVQAVVWQFIPRRDVTLTARWSIPKTLHVLLRNPLRVAKVRRQILRAKWDRTAGPKWVWPPPHRVYPPRPPGPAPVRGRGYLFLWDHPRRIPGHGRLHLGHRPKVLLFGTTIMQVPSLSLVKLPDRTPLAFSAVSCKIDRDSWAWELTATLLDGSLDWDPRPGDDPVLVEAAINGYYWQAVAEEFGQQDVCTWNLKGRSKTALLDSPYHLPSDYNEPNERTAAQLAMLAVDGTDFTVNWTATDWLIPGGLYAYSNQTPMAVIRSLAGVLQATVQSGRDDSTITVSPRYPTKPWEWADATPTAILTEAVILNKPLRTLAMGAGYQGVWVSGQMYGYSVHVRRQGTNGDPHATMVIEPWLTEAAANTERGIAILAEAAKWSTVTLTLPLFAAGTPFGLLLPGDLVEVRETREIWRGQVIETTVTGKLAEITQQIVVERD